MERAFFLGEMARSLDHDSDEYYTECSIVKSLIRVYALYFLLVYVDFLVFIVFNMCLLVFL